MMTMKQEPTAAAADSIADRFARVCLDRPERANALDGAAVERLHCGLDAADRQPTTRVLLVAAEGKNFSGGFDFSHYEQASEGDLLLRFTRIEQFLQRLRGAPYLTMARIQGAAYGAGADIAASCDYRVGTPRTRFRFPGYRFGVALGTTRLIAVVGEAKARSILLESRVVEAREALECGLLTHLVAEDELDPLIETLVAPTANFDPTSLRAMTASFRGASNGDRELAALVGSVARPGIHGRIKAFLEKTP